ncbi:MAG: DsrE family protein [Acidobacteriota bacterium]|jgi:predicted peroxiredoxin
MHLLILANGGSWDRRYQVTALAASAASVGDRVEIALFNAALASWVEGAWDHLDPAPPLAASRIEEAGFPPLSEMLDQARETGDLRLFGCSAAARLLGLDLAQVQRRVDAVVGWQTFARKIAQADRVVTL